MRLTIERARTLLLVAAVLLLAALGVFLVKAKWKNLLNRHDMPSQLAKDIQQEANGYTFVHAFGAHSQYRIHASKEVVLKSDRVELHDVQIDLYGEDGTRIDRIAGDTFEYDQKSGQATATGPVEMLLTRPAASAAVAKQAASEVADSKEKNKLIAEADELKNTQGQIDVKTSGVTFDRNTGLVTTAAKVNFWMTQGHGSATGARFDSQSGSLTLEHSVELTSARGGDPVEIQAQHAEFDRNAESCRMQGATASYRKVKAETEQARILFRKDGSAERLEAMGGFRLETADGGRMAAPVATMELDEHSQPRHAHMEGGVTLDSAEERRTVHGTAPSAEITFAVKGQIENAHLERGVAITSEETSPAAGGASGLHIRRTWNSPIVDVQFHVRQGSGKGRTGLESMRGTGGVTITSESRRGNGATTPAKMTADQVTGIFGAGRTLRSIVGVGHAGIEQTMATGARQTATGDKLTVALAENLETGSKGAREPGSKGAGERGSRETGSALEVESAELDGHVVLFEQPAQKPGTPTQMPLQATAGRAVYEGTGEWLHLTMNPRLNNGGLELTADKVDISQQSGEAFAHGNVKAAWTSQNAGGGQNGLTLGGKGPAHVVAAEAQVNQSTGEATFRGHARIWQQANSVTGPVIVLNQHLKTLTAQSTDAAEPVRTVLMGTSAPGGGKSAAQGTGQTPEAKAGAGSVIRVRGGELWYSDAERRATLRGGALGAVVAETGTVSSTSDGVDLRLLPAGEREAGSGAQAMVDHMTATGHVTITMQGKRGTGEKLEYSSASGDSVLTGTATAPPRLTDAEHGTVSGEALIFHSRDDSVSIEGGGRTTRTETTVPNERGK